VSCLTPPSSLGLPQFSDSIVQYCTVFYILYCTVQYRVPGTLKYPALYRYCVEPARDCSLSKVAVTKKGLNKGQSK
jgi:hypothetical protein